MARRANSPSRPPVTIHQFAPASVGSRESPMGSPTSMTQSPTPTYLASEPTGHVATTRPRTQHALAQARHLRPLSRSAERLWHGEDGRSTEGLQSGSGPTSAHSAQLSAGSVVSIMADLESNCGSPHRPEKRLVRTSSRPKAFADALVRPRGYSYSIPARRTRSSHN